jgi:hypothetical protein
MHIAHKEIVAHIRKRIKAAGISARVTMSDSCGQSVVHVFTTGPDVLFTESEQREIRFIAKCCKLTRAYGAEIDVDRMTDPTGMRFEYHADAYADLPEVVGRVAEAEEAAFNKRMEARYAKG